MTASVRCTVQVCESVLRDGIQGWPEILSTADKRRLVRAIVAARFTELDVTSFVPAAVVPQFADATEVLSAVPAGARTRVLTVNMKGVARVVEAHRLVRNIDTCGIPFSASEPHNIANLRRTHAEHKVVVEQMVDALHGAGITPLVAIATAYGCPIRGPVTAGEVLELAGWLYNRGVRRMMIGDTTGMADPAGVDNLFRTIVAQWPDVEFVAHFHDNRGCGIANTLAAISAGAQVVDACLGGLGGEPSAVDQGDVGESGNVVTEDLVAVLDRVGIDTGLDLPAVLRAGALVESVTGRRLHSRVLRAGLIDAGQREVA
jgi:hydroxymethylglutaryl-CoA lyase